MKKLFYLLLFLLIPLNVYADDVNYDMKIIKISVFKPMKAHKNWLTFPQVFPIKN